jgi:hypothetical protein
VRSDSAVLLDLDAPRVPLVRRAFPVLAILTVAGPAFAGERAVLEMTRGAGASECPDERGLSDLVAARLGYEPFVLDAPLRVAVHFARDAGKALRAEVVLFDAGGAQKGERILTSVRSDCEELASTTALTISIMLDPRAGMAPRPLPPEPPTPPKDPPLDEAPKPPSPAPPKVEPVRGRARLGAAAALAVGPALAQPSLYGGVGLGRSWWSIDAEARADVPVSAHDDATHGYDVEAGFVGGGLVPCSHFGVAFGCVGVWMGVLRTSIAGGDPPSQTSFFLSFGPRLGVSVPVVADLEIEGHVDGLYSPTAVEPHVAGAKIWGTSPVSASLGLGVLERFP